MHERLATTNVLHCNPVIVHCIRQPLTYPCQMPNLLSQHTTTTLRHISPLYTLIIIVALQLPAAGLVPLTEVQVNKKSTLPIPTECSCHGR